MSHTLSVRLEDDVAEWLEETARKSGLSQGQIVRDQLMKARENDFSSKPFMKLAGVKALETDLSTRKGFSRK